jgi:hypothetical protein
LFELMSGRLPHQAENPVLLLDAKFRTEPESLRTIAPERGIPKMLDATVSRALSTDPDHRFRSAAEMREALEAALHEPSAPRASRRKLAARGLASVIALSVLGLVGAVATRPAVRQRAMATLAPVMNQVHALQARAAERAHAAEPANVAVAHAEPVKVEAPVALAADVNAATAEVTVPSIPTSNEQVAAAVAAPAPNDDSEVEDDSASSDTTQKADPTATKGDTSAFGETAIAEAHRLTAQGNKLKALHVLRHAAKKVPTDGKVLQELAAAAEDNRGWGEAVRAARHWTEVAPSAESKLELARLERKTGHRERALELARSVVKDNPDSAEAHAMLSHLGGSERVALQK